MIEEVVRLQTRCPAWRQLLQTCRDWWLRCQRARRTGKRLVVSESVSLGDKRALLIAQFEHERFLIGMTGTSLTLLSRLPEAEK
jgi:hypothetical protein